LPDRGVVVHRGRCSVSFRGILMCLAAVVSGKQGSLLVRGRGASVRHAGVDVSRRGVPMRPLGLSQRFLGMGSRRLRAL
jgi:hypothetical protein